VDLGGKALRGRGRLGEEDSKKKTQSDLKKIYLEESVAQKKKTEAWIWGKNGNERPAPGLRGKGPRFFWGGKAGTIRPMEA